MKNIVVAAVLLLVGVCALNAQDLIILRDGNTIEAKVEEISPTEIRYKRFDHLDGPTIVVSAANVLSIRYENGRTELINAPASGTTANADSNQAGSETLLQSILNAMPAIPIAGNNLKFQFSGDTWTATVNGQNFSMGTTRIENTGNGCILTLSQTHVWPGAVGQTAGRFASRIPGGGAVGSALNTAGNVAGVAGAVEASGPEIVLEYNEGPPARLSLSATPERNGERAPRAGRGETAGQQREDIGLTLGLEYRMSDEDGYYAPHRIYPHAIYEKFFMDNSLELYAELGFPFFTHSYIDDEIGMYFNPGIKYNLFLGNISTLSFILETEIYHSILYGDGGDTSGVLIPGIRHTWTTGIGDIYAETLFPIQYISSDHYSYENNYDGGVGNVRFLGKLGWDSSFGLGFWIRQDIWFNDYYERSRFNFFISYENGHFYTELEASFYSHYYERNEYSRFIPKLQWAFNNGVKLWANCRITNYSYYDLLLIQPGIGISYSF